MRLIVAVVLVSVAALTAVLANRPILDTDYFWHLRTGALIAESGQVPRIDPYSYSAPGARWIDLHWLFQIALFQLHRLGGHAANQILGVVLAWAIVAVSALNTWRRDRPVLCGAALALLVTAACPRFVLRPDTVSLLLTAIVLGLLRRDERTNDRWIFAIVPIQLLWANLHGFHAVGLALIAMALIGEFVSPWFGAGHAARRDRIQRLGIVLGLGAVVALLNPNGVDGALLPLRQLGMIGPAATSTFGRNIDELRSPLAAFGTSTAMALLAFGALWLSSFAALLLDRRNLSPFDMLVWFAFALLAFSAARNTALFAVVAAPILAAHGGRWLDETATISAARQRAFGVAVAAVLALGAGAVVATAWSRGDGPRESSSPALASFWFPERAVDWIAAHRPPGPIYHRLGDGGFLIWRLWPDYSVLVDGRLEVYGEDLYREIEVDGDGGSDAFQRLDARQHFGTALIHFGLFRDSALLAWMEGRPEWRLVYLDEVAAVFVRSSAAEQAGWPSVNVDSPVLFEPLDATRRHPLDLWRRQARIAIFGALGRIGAARALLEETRLLYPSPALDALQARFVALEAQPGAQSQPASP